MTEREAIEFIRPAIDTDLRRWADLGAGTGTFTQALAALLGPGATVTAVEKDRAGLAALNRLAAAVPAESAHIDVVDADLRLLDSLPEIDGALIGNVLHFFADASPLLRMARACMAEHGTLVVLEYDGGRPSPWVPHPLSIDRLATLAAAGGFAQPEVVARRPSRYRGTIYCAVLRPITYSAVHVY